MNTDVGMMDLVGRPVKEISDRYEGQVNMGTEYVKGTVYE